MRVRRLLDEKPRLAAAPVPAGTPITRRERLRTALPGTVDLLARRRADMIETGFVEDYIALHWLVWRSGALHLTVTGKNVCAQLAST